MSDCFEGKEIEKDIKATKKNNHWLKEHLNINIANGICNRYENKKFL